MTTRAESVQLAAEFMRVVPVGQALRSEHDARLKNAYDWVYNRLENLGLAGWASTGSMPTEITPYFVGLMALNASNYFGVSADIYQKILLVAGANGVNGEKEIRLLIKPSYESIDQPTDY